MIARTLRAVAATAAATVALGMAGTTAAQAKPTAPGTVTGLVVDSVTHSASGYAVASHWNAVASATKYRVAVIKSGGTLVSTTVATTSWSGTLATTPGDATLTVRAVISRKPGPAASVLVHLPDVTAPVGAFHSSWTGSDGTITQDSLSDDSGGPVSRSVDWGDASPAEAWTTGTTLNHHYAGLGRFVPTVTLQDASSNTTVLTLDAIVIGDTTAPTGTFTVSPGTAWAKLTKVTVTQTSLGDDFSPVANITRTVEWGDGTTSSDWTPAGTISHVYATASSPSYTPQVTLTDEAHNSTAPIVTSAVVVTADTVAPVVRLLLPRAKHSVKAWTTLRGKATDTNGTGVKVVSLRAVEKRGTAWYGYQATTKRWVKAATMAKAFARSRALSLHTSSTNVWAGKLAGLRKGTLVYKVKATDNVGNASAVLTHKASLTRR